MIEYYLPNNNENTTVLILPNFSDLNRPQVGDDKRLVYEEGPWTGTMQAPVIASVHDIALAWPKSIQ